LAAAQSKPPSVAMVQLQPPQSTTTLLSEWKERMEKVNKERAESEHDRIIQLQTLATVRNANTNTDAHTHTLSL